MDQGKLPALAGASWLALLGAGDPAFVALQGMVKERAPFSSYIPVVAVPGPAGKTTRA